MGLAHQPSHLLVDLSGVTFCDVRGMALLVETGATAAGHGIGCAISGAFRQIDRAWTVMWAGDELPDRLLEH
ncbi:STAS domain-containing protein [Pseudonocardia saturnea]